MKVELAVVSIFCLLIHADETCDSEGNDDCKAKKTRSEDKYSKGNQKVSICKQESNVE